MNWWEVPTEDRWDAAKKRDAIVLPCYHEHHKGEFPGCKRYDTALLWLNGADTSVEYPECTTTAWYATRTQCIMRALEQTLGIDLVHDNAVDGYLKGYNRYARLTDNTPILPEGRMFKAHEDLRFVVPAFWNSWTKYYAGYDLDAVIKRFVPTCRYCEAQWSWKSITCKHKEATFMAGWTEFGSADFCSRLCEQSYFAESRQTEDIKRRHKQWLRRGRQLLVETRRLLKSPDRIHHEA